MAELSEIRRLLAESYLIIEKAQRRAVDGFFNSIEDSLDEQPIFSRKDLEDMVEDLLIDQISKDCRSGLQKLFGIDNRTEAFPIFGKIFISLLPCTL